MPSAALSNICTIFPFFNPLGIHGAVIRIWWMLKYVSYSVIKFPIASPCKSAIKGMQKPSWHLFYSPARGDWHQIIMFWWCSLGWMWSSICYAYLKQNIKWRYSQMEYRNSHLFLCKSNSVIVLISSFQPYRRLTDSNVYIHNSNDYSDIVCAVCVEIPFISRQWSFHGRQWCYSRLAYCKKSIR